MATATGPAPTSPPITLPTHDEIAKLAYEIWLAAGKPEGTAVSDWERAEAILMLGLTSPTQPFLPPAFKDEVQGDLRIAVDTAE